MSRPLAVPARERGVLHGLADRADLLATEGDHDGARRAAARALLVADRAGDELTGLHAAAIHGEALLALGNADGAAAVAGDMLGRSAVAGDPFWRARALALRAGAEVERQDMLAALDALAEALSLVEAGPPRVARHVAASEAVGSVLLRLSLFEAATGLLITAARRPVAGASEPRLVAVRTLLRGRLLWAAQLELLDDADAPLRYAEAASTALWMGRLARRARRPTLERAAVAAEAYAVERLGLPGLAAARAGPALAAQRGADRVVEWLPGRLALAAAAREAGQSARVEQFVAGVERAVSASPAAVGALDLGLVQPALARISAPPQGPGTAAAPHPAVPLLREIALVAARRMWQEREARAADLRQRILRQELARRSARTARELLVDPLTGLGNRRRLEQELALGSPGAVVFLDLDHFKRVNDQLGHEAGDAVLRRVASLLRDCCRTGDVVIRYGGDEFVVLLARGPGTGSGVAAARDLGARALDRVRRHDWSDLVGSLPVTVSVGVARGPQAGAALRRSDAALLVAKREGRDTLVEL